MTATAALEEFWSDDTFAKSVQEKGEIVRTRYEAMQAKFGDAIVALRGRGMMQGLVMRSGDLAGMVTKHAFKRGLVIETSGAHDEVVKCLAPLVIEIADLERGLDILEEAINAALADQNSKSVAAE